MNKKKLSNILDVIAKIATILGGIIAILMFLIAFSSLKKDVRIVQVGIEEVKQQTLKSQLKIISPINGALVESSILIQGETPYLDKNHYTIITPLKAGGDFVQEGPLQISSSGLWSGIAYFGSAAVGIGEKFAIRIITTNMKLSSGHLSNIPKDAIISESITVKRIK